MDIFAGLICERSSQSKSGGKFGPRKNSNLTAMTEYVRDNPGCIGSDVSSAVGCYRQIAHAGLWALEKRGILTSKMRPVPLTKRRANDAAMQKHYWVVE